MRLPYVRIAIEKLIMVEQMSCCRAFPSNPLTLEDHEHE